MTQQAPFPCDPQLWQRFLTACHSRDETPGAVLRDLVRLEVQRMERRTARFCAMAHRSAPAIRSLSAALAQGFRGTPGRAWRPWRWLGHPRQSTVAGHEQPYARRPTVATPKTSSTLASISGAFMPATLYIASGLA